MLAGRCCFLLLILIPTLEITTSVLETILVLDFLDSGPAAALRAPTSVPVSLS
jgi:hypothetical protein